MHVSAHPHVRAHTAPKPLVTRDLLKEWLTQKTWNNVSGMVNRLHQEVCSQQD